MKITGFDWCHIFSNFLNNPNYELIILEHGSQPVGEQPILYMKYLNHGLLQDHK